MRSLESMREWLIREAEHKSVREIAKDIGLNHVTLYRLINKSILNPKFDTLDRINTAMGTEKPCKQYEKNYMTIEEMQDKAFANASVHGFHNKPQSLGEKLCLIHSELSEALEADRSGKWADLESFYAEGRTNIAFLENIKDTVEDEMADAVIRIADLCGSYGINLQEHIKLKMEFNSRREYLHGKKY